MSVNVTQTGYGAIVDVTQTGQAAQVDVIVSRGLPGSDATYTLPTATASVLGGVKIGSGITITDGVISASSSYTLPTATDSILGGVKIGSGVTITDGVISVSTNYDAAGSAATAQSNAIAASLQRASNLSDLASASSARSNLGLGTLATQSGTFSGVSSGTNTGDNAVNTSSAPARELVTASTLTAVAGGRYIISNAGLCTITDPATGSVGQSYTVIVGVGTAKWATGNTYAASRFELVRYCTATNTWATLSPVLSDAQTITLAPGANTSAPGATLANATAATIGNQQHSPFQYWTGQGWKTTATAASQEVTFRAGVVPVQGATNPTGTWTLQSSVNGGAFGNSLSFSSSGALQLSGANYTGINFNGTTNQGITSGATLGLYFVSNGSNIIHVWHNPSYPGIAVRSGDIYSFSANSNVDTAPDTGLCRISAGVVGIGNGTPGSIAGSLSLTNLTSSGSITLSKTITAPATTGAQTINQTSGRVNFAAAATSLVVTNSLCTANSIIHCTIATNDTTATGLRVVAAAGSFTIYLLTAPTSETAVNFLLTN